MIIVVSLTTMISGASQLPCPAGHSLAASCWTRQDALMSDTISRKIVGITPRLTCYQAAAAQLTEALPHILTSGQSVDRCDAIGWILVGKCFSPPHT